MNKLTSREIADFLGEKDDFVILTHKRPDGDTIGSAALLCRGLRAIGKRAFLLENPEITPKYAPYAAGLTCPEWKDGQTLLTVDVASETMFPKGGEELAGRISLLVDHHGSNTGFAPRGLVVPEAAACGEIVMDILEKLGVSLDKPMADAAYVALSTDTGCFRYANTTAVTLRCAAQCLEAGADAYAINRVMFEQVRFARLRLNGYLAEHTKFYAGGKVALCPIPLEVEQEYGITQDDMDDISGFARNIEGVELAVTLRTTGSGGTKLSVRAVPGYNASAICAHLGGGGHPGAAGASVEEDQQTAMERILAAMAAEGIAL